MRRSSSFLFFGTKIIEIEREGEEKREKYNMNTIKV